MRVRLYQYNGPSDAANKLEGLSAVYDSINEPTELYGTFSPYAATFTLDRLISCNFALYDFSGIDYFGSVLTTTTADGLYNYQVNIDPLTTAWYRGCMNTSALIAYDNAGNPLMIDDRIARAEEGLWLSVPYSSSAEWDKYAIVMNVAALYPEFDPQQLTEYEELIDNVGPVMSNTPGATTTFVFEDITGSSLIEEPTLKNNPARWNAATQYRAFLNTLLAHQNNLGANISNYIASVISCYVVPAPLIHNYVNYGVSSGSQYVTLYCWPNTILAAETKIAVHRLEWDSGEKITQEYHVGRLNNTDQVLTSFSWPITSDYRNGPMWNTDWVIHIPNIGTLSFIPSRTIPSSATAVGCQVVLNPVGKFYSLELFYEDTANVRHHLPEYCTVVGITETVAVPYGGTGSNLAQDLVSGIGGIAAGAGTGGAIGGVVGAGVGAVVSGIGSLVGSLRNTAPGSTSTPGGYYDRSRKIAMPTLTINYIPYEDEQATFAVRYAMPTHRTKIISSCPSGYVQTQNARLLRNGLPADIITSAEQQCDAGFRII